jgi:hypothetical protein
MGDRGGIRARSAAAEIAVETPLEAPLWESVSDPAHEAPRERVSEAAHEAP